MANVTSGRHTSEAFHTAEKGDTHMIAMFAASKGGVGKSLLSINTAVGLSRRRGKPPVCIIDCDVEGGAMSSSRWMCRRLEALEGKNLKKYGDVTVVKAEKDLEALCVQIEELDEQYEHIIIDGPPIITGKVEFLSRISDVVVVSFSGISIDLEPQLEFIDHLRTQREESKSLYEIGLCAVRVRHYQREAMEEILSAPADVGADCCIGLTGQREVYEQAFEEGLAIPELRGSSGPRGAAKEEMTRIITSLVAAHSRGKRRAKRMEA